MKPSTPRMSGNGASVLKPNTHRGMLPTALHAKAQIRPIPIAPRTRRSQLPITASVSSFVDDDLAALHHPPDLADRDVDIAQRIAFDSDDVGVKSRRDFPELARLPEQRRRVG